MGSAVKITKGAIADRILLYGYTAVATVMKTTTSTAPLKYSKYRRNPRRRKGNEWGVYAVGGGEDEAG